jgi:KaiC/GvpD/RAD55 family RecA-like ATPase
VNYIRLSETLKGSYQLLPETTDIQEIIKLKPNTDFYQSIFKYNEEQYNHWKKTKSVAGIKNVFTDKIVLDFDDKADPENARRDALIAIDKVTKLGVPPENIQLAFSGKKGFSIEFKINKTLTPEEFKLATFNLCSDLPTFDKVVNDCSRVFRVIGTKHQDSGLYKYPLTIDQLKQTSVEEIKELAVDLSTVDDNAFDYSKWEEPVELPAILLKEKDTPFKEAVTKIESDLNLSKKPRWLTNAKYALQEGFFPTGEGQRHTVFMILAATYKTQGFDRKQVYRMLKSVAEKQADRTGTDRFPDDELWSSITHSVFSPEWQGGQYGPDHPIIQATIAQLNLPKEDKDTVLVGVDNVSNIFKNFAENIDKNTMKLGIDLIDKNVRITTSMVVGLLGAPSSGKTTLAINFLNHASKNNVKSLFFSLDMGAPLVFQRLIQRHTSKGSDELFRIYRNKEVETIKEIESKINENYKNVGFSFKTGLTVDDLRNAILDEQERSEEKVKLVVVDYLECIAGPYSDATANTALIAQKLKDIANDLELTLVLLLQPQKHAGDPSDELLSYRNIKGSSAVEQAASIVLSVWRPGFSAKRPQDDKFLSMAVLKNRMGGLSQFDFNWNGLEGTISNLEPEDAFALKEVRDSKKAESQPDGGF